MWLGIKNNHRQSQKHRQQWQARATLTMRRMSNAAMRGRTMDGLAVCLSARPNCGLSNSFAACRNACKTRDTTDKLAVLMDWPIPYNMLINDVNGS